MKKLFRFTIAFLCTFAVYSLMDIAFGDGFDMVGSLLSSISLIVGLALFQWMERYRDGK